MLLTALSCGASVALTVAWLLDSLDIAARSDAELIAQFHRSAFEDIFGFGFWFTWSLIALVEFALLGAGWLLLRKHWLQPLVPLLLVAFAVSSVFDYRSYHRELELWQGYTSRPTR
jgi:hypothetical protein